MTPQKAFYTGCSYILGKALLPESSSMEHENLLENSSSFLGSTAGKGQVNGLVSYLNY
jgi:hypothetical protein